MKLLVDHPVPESCATLLSRVGRPVPARSQKLIFAGVGDKDVYNIAAPFELAEQVVLAGRVERRAVEHSEIMFFVQVKDCWQPIPSAVTFPGLQDPCVTFIGGELVVGGVRFPIPLKDGSSGWRMEFYHGRDLSHLELFLTGPDKMKDIRLVELADKRVGVLTRPQGIKGGRGKIGFFIAESLECVTAEAIQNAPLLPGQCLEHEWLGSNEAHRLANGMIGVLGHIACFDTNDHRHYYPMVFCLNPHNGQATCPEIIASRADFPPGPAKRSDLADVVFSGGLRREADGSATLYAGLSDVEAGWVSLPDPFKRWESGVFILAS